MSLPPGARMLSGGFALVATGLSGLMFLALLGMRGHNAHDCTVYEIFFGGEPCSYIRPVIFVYSVFALFLAGGLGCIGYLLFATSERSKTRAVWACLAYGVFIFLVYFGQFAGHLVGGMH